MAPENAELLQDGLGTREPPETCATSLQPTCSHRTETLDLCFEGKRLCIGSKTESLTFYHFLKLIRFGHGNTVSSTCNAARSMGKKHQLAGLAPRKNQVLRIRCFVRFPKSWEQNTKPGSLVP